MLSSDIVGHITQQSLRYGNLPVILQADAEGNGYDYARGIDFIYVTRDLQHTFDSLDEAGAEDYEEDDLIKALVIYP